MDQTNPTSAEHGSENSATDGTAVHGHSEQGTGKSKSTGRSAGKSAAEATLARWHDMVARQDQRELGDILTDDCVFLSPVVHTPQEGRDITVLYLTGASAVFGDSFTYTKEVVSDRYAMLEFESTVDGILINGIDIITFADDGRICEFRVMVRPLKAMQMLHGKMAAMLDQLKSAGA